MDSVNMSSTEETNDVINLSQSQSEPEHDPQPETPSGSKNLQKRIINFSVISSHKGEAIGKAVESCFVDWGIEKIGTITLNNASANDVAIAYAKRKFSKNSDSLILRDEYLHMRCCAHIINLIVKDGLSEIKDSKTRIRNEVKYVRSFPQREQFFRTCVETEKVTCESLLYLDVQIRWNSTYLMLDVATKFQKVFERLEDKPPHFKLELNHGPPTTQDWEDAHVFTQFL
ncbi:zinc finger BED domain-containing protein RICESLEEPER 2-like [Camellia sinensis]|uniref:zinc finger BED domain-containing protein RICESLEEPER 2-like n=1 Tax=Camellia sinensis TaxID=4442 RepID=UPI0010357448|nr:zinc finger BED domain-containing protein RICESLEEPER 2-like [Camellia sinensis]